MNRPGLVATSDKARDGSSKVGTSVFEFSKRIYVGQSFFELLCVVVAGYFSGNDEVPHSMKF